LPETSSAANVPQALARRTAAEERLIISSTTERVFNIQHVGGPEAKATMTNNGSSTNSIGPAKLVFHKYGNAYFLAAAWMPNSPPTSSVLAENLSRIRAA